MIIIVLIIVYLVVMVYLFGWRQCTSWQFEVQVNKPANAYYRLGVSYLPLGPESECLSIGFILIMFNLYFYFDDLTAGSTPTNL